MYNLEIHQEYAKWDKIHTRMKDAPPPEGRDYLKHAMNLLSLLEGIAEVHPIAKAVVVCFRTAVMFEQDRQENDVRVTAVFLAQTDMMRVLLDIDDLFNRRQEAEISRTTLALPDLLSRIQEDIKACHNSIDTYYKEQRLVKFWKARDWKDRMLGFIETFNQSRLLLQQAISLRVASGVDELASKMDLVLSRVFAPKYTWEKELATKIQSLGNPSEWIDDSNSLRSLAVATKDPLLDIDENQQSGTMARVKATIQLDRLKEDLQLPLDALCQRNLELFELKLKLHTERLEEAIMHSARVVIRNLSGPHDRLEHEDLRALWKEMNWIFCVENKFFSIALFEYYLDRFSIPRIQANSDLIEPLPVISEAPNPEAPELALASVQKLDVMYKLSSVNHPDAWTLQYMSTYGNEISAAIDLDGSGLIRISEANFFTSQIPSGWSLPQWCAYLGAGRLHENRIYRKRITHLRNKLNEKQSQLLSHNRMGAGFLLLLISQRLIHYVCLEPRGQNKLSVTPELHDLVKAKINAQDVKLRSRLQSIKWAIEDESTIDLLFEEEPPEKYFLPLLCALMEHVLDTFVTACSVNVDLKEWIDMSESYTVVRSICEKRIEMLKVKFKGDRGAVEDVGTYLGGIWSFLEKTMDVNVYAEDLDETVLVSICQEDLTDFYSDISLLDEFPITPLTGSLVTLNYSTWEEFSKTLEISKIPSSIPITWNPLEEGPIDPDLKMAETVMTALPLTGWYCNRCNVAVGSQRRYNCTVCYDFDFCNECYSLPESDHIVANHNFDHHMIVMTSFVHRTQRAWMTLRAKMAIEKFRNDIMELEIASLNALTDNPVSDQNSDDAPTTVDAAQDTNSASETSNAAEITENIVNSATSDSMNDTAHVAPETTTANLEATKSYPADDHLQNSTEDNTEIIAQDLAVNDTEDTEASVDSSVAEQDAEQSDEDAAKDIAEDAAEDNTGDTGNDAAETNTKLECGRCSAAILIDSKFYLCLEYSCHDFYLCDKCANEFSDPEGTHHFWWHSLLLIDKRSLQVKQQLPSSLSSEAAETAAKNESGNASLPGEHEVDARFAGVGKRISGIEDKMAILQSKMDEVIGRTTGVEEKIAGLESKVEDRIARLESKMDDMFSELMKGLSVLLVNKS